MLQGGALSGSSDAGVGRAKVGVGCGTWEVDGTRDGTLLRKEGIKTGGGLS